MDRKSFFKTLIGGAAVAVIGPSILAAKEAPSVTAAHKKVIAVDINNIPAGVPIDEVLKIWRQTGELPYQIPYKEVYPYMEELYKRYGGVDSRELLQISGGIK